MRTMHWDNLELFAFRQSKSWKVERNLVIEIQINNPINMYHSYDFKSQTASQRKNGRTKYKNGGIYIEVIANTVVK